MYQYESVSQTYERPTAAQITTTATGNRVCLVEAELTFGCESEKTNKNTQGKPYVPCIVYTHTFTLLICLFLLFSLFNVFVE